MEVFKVFLCVFVAASSFQQSDGAQRFPESFMFGVATSAYQIEGAWATSDKAESIWDNFTHGKPSRIVDGSTGDEACDSYHLYKRDVQMLRELGVDFYRFSISWPRLLPSGFSDKVSRDGVLYYTNLINELLLYNITPVVTLYHWDLPNRLQELGGWSNPLMTGYFLEYAKVVFEYFGSKVKTWITFNGPTLICTNGYGTDMDYAPSVHFQGVMEYLCSHHILLAHSAVYNLYKKDFKPVQQGRVGITLYSPWVEPLSNLTEAKEVAERAMQFTVSLNQTFILTRDTNLSLLGWQAHPIFSKDGDYPALMKASVYNRSILQGYSTSRLPEFTPMEIELLKGSADFLGLNYYTSLHYRAFKGQRPHFPEPSLADDLGLELLESKFWEKSTSKWLWINPTGIRKVLNWIKLQYDNPEVIITETGLSTEPGLMDLGRVAFLQQTLTNVAQAVEDGCNVTALAVWSLMDNFQWTSGYTERFGLFEVDFHSRQKTRSIRVSALVYKNIIETKVVNPFYTPVVPKSIFSSSPAAVNSKHVLLVINLVLFFCL